MKRQGTLEILVGISGSGKSTYAHKMWEKDPKNTTIVNRDKIRELLFGYTESALFKYYDRDDVYQMEKRVTEVENEMILNALGRFNKVIADATHLKQKYIESFWKYNVPTDLIIFKVDKEECIERDSKRVRTEGVDTINKQYERAKSLNLDLTNAVKISDNIFKIVNYKFNKKPLDHNYDINKRDCIVVDIDGTVAHNNGYRSPFDWGKVGQDSVIDNVATLVKLIGKKHSSNLDLIICSGRDASCGKDTLNWLYKYEFFPSVLYMRKRGDNRPDYIVKEEMWRGIEKEYNIIAMIDDRDQVVNHARALGYTVLQTSRNTF